MQCAHATHTPTCATWLCDEKRDEERKGDDTREEKNEDNLA